GTIGRSSSSVTSGISVSTAGGSLRATFALETSTEGWHPVSASAAAEAARSAAKGALRRPTACRSVLHGESGASHQGARTGYWCSMSAPRSPSAVHSRNAHHLSAFTRG